MISCDNLLWTNPYLVVWIVHFECMCLKVFRNLSLVTFWVKGSFLKAQGAAGTSLLLSFSKRWMSLNTIVLLGTRFVLHLLLPLFAHTRIKTRCPSRIHTWLLSNGRLFMPVPSPMLAKHFSYLLVCVLSSCVSFSSFFKLQAVAGLVGAIPICISSEWHELRCHHAFLPVPWVCLNLHLEKVFCKYSRAVTELHCTNLASLLCVARGANFLWNNLCIVLCK